MATIDLKLKSYDELIFEITKLNTDKYLLKQENKQLQDRIDKALEYIEIIEYNETYGKGYIDYHELIEILKGEENEQISKNN